MAKALQVSGTHFSWKGNVGSTEISDTGLQGFPERFYIKSQKTGELRLFLASERIPNGEDLGGYRYISPGQNLEVTIWND